MFQNSVRSQDLFACFPWGEKLFKFIPSVRRHTVSHDGPLRVLHAHGVTVHDRVEKVISTQLCMVLRRRTSWPELEVKNRREVGSRQTAGGFDPSESCIADFLR